MNLGKAIKLFRTNNGVRQNWVADKAGITNVYLSLIEHGGSTPSLRVLYRISKALDIRMSELFVFAEELE